MSKSLWVQFRDWLENLVHHTIEFLNPTIKALATAIPEALQGQVGEIIKQAVTIAENTGGTGSQKFDAALAAIIPQLEALGIKLGKILIQTLVNNAILELGFSKGTANVA